MPTLADAAAALSGGDRHALYACAADPTRPSSDRVTALAALAIDATRARAADPEIAALLDDAPLVDAAIAAGLAGAVTALALALGDALPLGERRYLTKVLAGARATGIHVANLALVAGEP